MQAMDLETVGSHRDLSGGDRTAETKNRHGAEAAP